jgi:hypothetical protein
LIVERNVDEYLSFRGRTEESVSERTERVLRGR